MVGTNDVLITAKERIRTELEGSVFFALFRRQGIGSVGALAVPTVLRPQGGCMLCFVRGHFVGELVGSEPCGEAGAHVGIYEALEVVELAAVAG